MPRFRYRAVSPDGQLSAGDMLAASTHEVVARIQALGHIPLEAEPAAESWLQALFTRELRPARRDSARLLLPLIRQLGVLLRAGLPLDRALEILQEVAARPAEAALPRRLLDRIRGGSALADAMAEEPVFPPYCVTMVRAGEASGTLDGVLDRLAGFVEKSQASRAKIVSALLYPAIVLVACAASLIVLFAFVVPRFEPFFADARVALPFTTRLLLATGHLVQEFWWQPVVALLIGGAWLAHLARDPRHRHHCDAAVLKLPLIGDLVRKVEIAQFSRILGTLLKNGVALIGALQIAGETIRNRPLAAAITGCLQSVKQGNGLAEPLTQSGAVPALALRLIRVGEETARLDDMLLELASIYDGETAQRIERALALLGPTLTVGLGLLVALVIGSIMTAILSVYELAG